MYTATARATAENWFEPPEPILDRYMLRSRSKAANDNRHRSMKTSRTMRMATCVALIGAFSLLVL
ncbi:hypothetical protein OCOJLMKI_3276 [Methylobacterium iners]|uniref:Uncharacterized protein n=1 Tax=Methylobacterium iners TaxID=418707 RepID=A0ABQ4S0V0_9HYPH|nr:hypothetical protein OCOJLMKI_3276 [Methylobacterium iners]